MFRSLCFAITLLFVALPQGTSDLAKKCFSATALLYGQSEDGGMRMLCTTTAFEKTKTGYLFVSAAHCVADDDEDHERVEVEKRRFYVTFDEKADKKFYPAKVEMVGYQHRGDDFSVLSVNMEQGIEPLALGDEREEPMGAEVINIASPRGLGRQVFHGWISMPFIDRPIVEQSINWNGAMLLQIEAGPGSSGSAIISVGKEQIVGFLVGTFDTNTFAVPVSKFKLFKKAVEDGKYKWFKKDEEAK